MKIRRPDMLLLAVVLFIALIVFLQIREGFEAKPFNVFGNYSIGDYVTYGGKTYVRKSDGLVLKPFLDDYSPSMPHYPAGAVVFYNGNYYRAKANILTQGVSPDNTEYWSKIDKILSRPASDYEPGRRYNLADVVNKNGRLHHFVYENNSLPTPGYSSAWEEVAPPTPVPNPVGQAAPPPIDIKPALPTVAPMKPIPSNAMPLNPLAPTPPGVASSVTTTTVTPGPVAATPGKVEPTVVLPTYTAAGTYMLRQVF